MLLDVPILLRSAPVRRLSAGALAVVLAVVCLSPLPAWAQEDEPTVASGTVLLQEGRFDAAADAFRAVIEREPENGIAWYRLGMALQEGGAHEEAIAALERAAELGFQAPYARVRIARAHAALGREEAALTALETGVEEGLDMPGLLENPAFEAFSGDERFRGVVAATQRAADPCGQIEAYRAFDFWIGDWEVYNPAGDRIGENRIEPLLDSCGLLENWTDARGAQGKSLNAYDRNTGLWRQLWVSDRGTVTNYRNGRIVDGALHFEATVVGEGADTTYQRMIFTPVAPDTVRQEILTSEDGESWTSAFVGIYVRRGDGAGGSGAGGSGPADPPRQGDGELSLAVVSQPPTPSMIHGWMPSSGAPWMTATSPVVSSTTAWTSRR